MTPAIDGRSAKPSSQESLMLSEVEKAVIEWIAAEWAFRAGPEAYRSEPANRFEKAQRSLRRAFTGKGDLDKAHNAILRRCFNGGKIPD